jgi:hypothetical protein
MHVVPAAAATGSVQFLLWKDLADTFAYGAPYTLNILQAMQQARLTFAAAAGDLAGIDVGAVAFPGGGSVSVITPGGGQWDVFSFGAGGLSRRIGPLNATGNWTMHVVPAAAATGSARFTLWKDLSGTLSLGVPSDVTVAFPNQQVRMTFAGAAGQFAGLGFSNVQGFTGGNVSVITPGGGTWDVFSFGTGDIGRRLGPLNATGNWVVSVVPAASGTGTFRLRLWNDVADPLTVGTPYALSIPNPGQQARLPFTGAAGNNLGFELSGVTFPGGGVVNVLRPDGLAILNTSFGAGGLSLDIPTLTQAGTHIVNVIPAASGTGGATVRVFNR